MSEPASAAAFRSIAAETIGREGVVTVWDDNGRYLGCMGVNLWRALLESSTTSSRTPAEANGPNVVHGEGA